MKELIESLFLCNWKSYKTFESSGRVKLHSSTDYQEFDFSENKILTIIRHSKLHPSLVRKAKTWLIELEKNKQILKVQFLKDRCHFEVVSINHTNMVLKDMSNDDKIFFAKTNAWSKLIRH
jgi:hypothetical protein